MDDVRRVSDAVFATVAICPQCKGTLDIQNADKTYRVAECRTCHLRIKVTTRHNDLINGIGIALLGLCFGIFGFVIGVCF